MSHFKEELYFIGEVWDEQKVIERYSAVFGAGFNFPLSYAIKESVKERNPARLWQGINATLINKKYIPVNFLNNHDMSRTLTYMNGSKRKTLFSYSILLTLPGMPCIYYGEELGMKGNYHKHYPEEVLEPFPWYQAGAGPFQTQWKASKKNTPYSGISREYQKKNFDSYFNKFKKMLSFRGQRKWIDSATITGINIKNDLFSVFLKNSNHKVHLYYNYSDNKKKIQNKSGTPVEIYGKINYRSHYLEIFPFSTLAVEKRADSISPF
jgi:glycosidase